MAETDLISRQAAIDAIEKESQVDGAYGYMDTKSIVDLLNDLPSAQPEEKVLTEEDYAYCLECNHIEMCKWYPIYGCEFKDRLSAYTEDEIQKIQDLEQAQLNKMYQLGYEDGLAERSWVPCNAKLPEESGRYLVTRGLKACGSLWNRIYIANYSDLMGIKSEKIWWQGNVGKSDFEPLDDVLAWMPLPECYRGEKE